MITYQDLLKIGDSDKKRSEFVRNAIYDHKRSDSYKIAKDADEYYKHKNVTITNFQKMLYTVSGKEVPDMWSANYKMASRFFYRFVTQKVQYLLGNGASWNEDSTKDKLGNKKYPFDSQLQKGGKYALTMGVSFGFFNLDHIEIFNLTEFVPIWDEENGSLSAGIRFWQISDSKPLRATLYEMDGYTDFIWRNGDSNNILHEKRPYKLKTRTTVVDGEEIYDGENYPGFPIVPFWGNENHQSELIGLREQIDCYDLIKSGFADNVDEASIIYWTLTNAGGMNEVDLATFVQRMKTVHAHAFDDQVTAQANTMDAPFASREALLARLERDLYKDAMALNTENIAGGAVTATQIRASYEPLNSATDDFEYCVIEFVNGILEIAEIDDEVSFTRSVIVNATEEMNMLLQSANYLSADYVTEKAIALLGDLDKLDDIKEEMETDDIARFNGGQEENELGTAEEDNEGMPQS